MATWLTTSSMAAAATGRGREGEEGCQRQSEIGMGSGGRRVERSGEGRRRLLCLGDGAYDFFFLEILSNPNYSLVLKYTIWIYLI